MSKGGADGIDLLSVGRTLYSTGYPARAAKPLLLRSKWFFVFSHPFKNKFLTDSGKQKPDEFSSGFAALAVRTGLEPATLGVTGRYSNQTELPHQKIIAMQN